MKNIITIMAALMVALFATSSWAFTPPPSPAPSSWISDPSHVLSDEAHARLDAKLKQVNQSSANEMAALIVPTLEGADIADVGDLTAKSWGVGKKDLDNGVLVVLAMKEHKSRISTGKGVEGDLPDLKCNDILQSARPYLRSGNVEGALGFIFDNASSAIANHKAEVAARATKPTSKLSDTDATSSNQHTNTACAVSAVGAGGGTIFLVVLGVGALLVGVYLGNRRRQRLQLEEEATRERLRMEQAQRRRAAEEARQRLEQRITVVSAPRPVSRTTPAPIAPVTPSVFTAPCDISDADVAASAAAEANKLRQEAEDRARRERRAEEDRRAREQEESNRRRREQEESDRRRRDEETSSSSSFSSPSWDSDNSGGSNGGFGGGDVGGGGSSSDW